MGIATILRICATLHILMMVGLYLSIMGGSWLPDGASANHMATAEILGIMILSHAIGVGVILGLASTLKDVASARVVLLGEIIFATCMLGAFIFANLQDSWYDGPPIPVLAMIVVCLLLSTYGRLKVTRM